MEHNICLISMILELLLCCSGCSNQDTGKAELPEVSARILYKYDIGNGQQRIFYQVKYGQLYQIFTQMSDKSSKLTRIETIFNRFEGDYDFYVYGAPDPYLYVVSPDKEKLYVITNLHPNSDGWTIQYQLFCIDCKTLMPKLLTACAAIRATDHGFTVAQPRLTNEDTSRSTADEIWAIHDEDIDWNGNLVSNSSEEYDYDEMERRYSNPDMEFWNVQNFNVIE